MRFLLGGPFSVASLKSMIVNSDHSVFIVNAEDGSVLREIPVPNVIELGFSPKATFLSTWERPGVFLKIR